MPNQVRDLARDSLRRCCPSSARPDRPRLEADCHLLSDRDSFATAAIAGSRTSPLVAPRQRSVPGATGCRRRSDRGSARTDPSPSPLPRPSRGKTQDSLPERSTPIRCSTDIVPLANLKFINFVATDPSSTPRSNSSDHSSLRFSPVGLDV